MDGVQVVQEFSPGRNLKDDVAVTYCFDAAKFHAGKFCPCSFLKRVSHKSMENLRNRKGDQEGLKSGQKRK
jgi:hypothetical protein